MISVPSSPVLSCRAPEFPAIHVLGLRMEAIDEVGDVAKDRVKYGSELGVVAYCTNAGLAEDLASGRRSISYGYANGRKVVEEGVHCHAVEGLV